MIAPEERKREGNGKEIFFLGGMGQKPVSSALIEEGKPANGIGVNFRVISASHDPLENLRLSRNNNNKCVFVQIRH